MAGLYIHIPFCHAKCGYCDFYSSPRREWAEAFTESLINEWEERKSSLEERIETIYIGGGTPSSLPLTLLDRIISHLPVNSLREFTIEVNPEDITDEFCRWLADSPADRVSMGVQSLSDNELRAIGRRHSAAEAIEAVGRLREKGDVGNLSLDLIYGLPGQTLDSWKESLKGMIGLKPEHLSAYLLSYEPGTRLTAMLKTGKIEEAPEETVTQMYHELIGQASLHGYSHYEISNFALAGREAVHNSSYWDMTPYIGLGPGAHSFDGRTRGYNPPDLKGYINKKGRGIFVGEPENQTEHDNDLIITSLRTSKGLDLGSFTPTRRQKLLDSASPWFSDGSLEWVETDRRFRIGEKSWLISDRILVDLIE